MTPKHAYLIIAHHEPLVLSTLLHALDDSRNDIFLHIDQRADNLRRQMADLHTAHAGLIILPHPLKVYWGDISQVKAEFMLLEAAVQKEEYAYYHLLSGVDLPLKSQDYIHRFFQQHAGLEFVGFWQSAAQRRELDKRVSRYFFFTKALRPKDTLRHVLATPLGNILLIGQKLLGIRRKKEVEFKKGPQWFSISHAFCLYLLSQKAWVLKRFAHTLCPDELFVQSVLWNSPFRAQIYNETDTDRGCMRLIDWERGAPYTWQATDFKELTLSDKLFARKFSSARPDLLERICNGLCLNSGPLL